MTHPDHEDIRGLKQSVETILQALHNSGLMGRFEREGPPLRGTPRDARTEDLGVGERLGYVSEIAVDEVPDRDLYSDGEGDDPSANPTGARPKRVPRKKNSPQEERRRSRSSHGSPPRRATRNRKQRNREGGSQLN